MLHSKLVCCAVKHLMEMHRLSSRQELPTERAECSCSTSTRSISRVASWGQAEGASWGGSIPKTGMPPNQPQGTWRHWGHLCKAPEQMHWLFFCLSCAPSAWALCCHGLGACSPKAGKPGCIILPGSRSTSPRAAGRRTIPSVTVRAARPSPVPHHLPKHAGSQEGVHGA